MPELNDRHTDELFQVGAGRHNFEYNPAAWEQMEGLLDADVRARRLRLLAAALLGLLALTFLWWMTLGPAGSAAVTDAAAGPTEAENTASLAGNLNDAETAAQVLGRELPEETATAVQPATTAADEPDVRPANTGVPITSGQPRSIPTFAPSEGEPVTEAPQVGAQVARNEPVATTDRPEAASSTTIPSLPIVDAVVSTAQQEIDFRVESVESFKSTAVGQKVVGIVSAGAIFGRSGGDPFEQPRGRFGAELEYRMGKKFALSAGAYYNTVCYKTEEENYNPKDDFWHQDVLPDWVRGECQALEIPLSLKYYFSGSANSSLYVSGGASSYILIKEDYEYLYDEMPTTEVKTQWTERMNNNHPLGMGHFSLGYQQRLRGSSALKIESFVQLPFTGIGHGDVRLLTTGLSLNYQFGLGKRK